MLKKLLIFVFLTTFSSWLFGMDQSQSTSEQVKQLWIACKTGDMAAVTRLLHTEGVNPTTRLSFEQDHRNSTFLHYAAHAGHSNIVQELILTGASVNAVDKNGWTPLIPALVGGHEDVVDLLLKHQADVNVVDNVYMHTPIATSIQCLYPSLVEKLLTAGAETHSLIHSDGDGDQYIMITIDPFHTLFKRLQKKPDYAPSYSAQETEDRALAIIEILRRHNVDLHAQDNDCQTAFHLAAQLNNKRFICALMVRPLTPPHDKCKMVAFDYKKEMLTRLRTFLLINKQHNQLPRLPQDVLFHIFAHMPIECRYAHIEQLVVPHCVDTATFRTRFLDECWPDIREHRSWRPEVAAGLLQILNASTRDNQTAAQVATELSIKEALNPHWWR